MRLVEAGIVGLDDLVSMHVDEILAPVMNATMARLFVPHGVAVTIRHLVSMHSGIPDFDVPSYDNLILNSNTTQSPMDILRFAATQNWTCVPGTCTSYSSTNYVLLGFVLLRHQPGLTTRRGRSGKP